jgi:hypothetical protein
MFGPRTRASAEAQTFAPGRTQHASSPIFKCPARNRNDPFDARTGLPILPLGRTPERRGGYTFAFYGVKMFLQLLWMFWIMPETKGVPLEKIQREMGTE